MSTQKAKAKINQKLAIRFAVGLTILAVAFVGLYTLLNRGTDLDIGEFASKGYVSASMETPDGTVAVLISPDGKVLEAPGRAKGRQDAAPVWNKDGSRLYFISDREDDASHIFRWNPGAQVGGMVQRRSIDGRSKTFISFQSAGPSDTALMIAGGTVSEFDPARGSSAQVLPPLVLGGSRGSDGGRADAFAGLYSSLGDSFRVAMWSPDRTWIAAVMRREEGEMLIIQDLTKREDLGGKIGPPTPIIAGDKVDIDVSATGVVAIAVMNFQFPDPENPPEEFIKNGKVVTPFKSYLGFLDVNAKSPPTVLFSAPSHDISFASPKFSPDGSRILVQVGKYTPGEGLKVSGVASVLAQEGGAAQPTPVLNDDDCYDISWSPDGEKVLFTRVMDGFSRIYSISKDGGKAEPIGPADKNFSGPLFSPQK